MRKLWIFIIIIGISVSMYPATVFAGAVPIVDGDYTYYVKPDGTACLYPSEGASFTGDIYVPSTIGGYTVTEMFWYAYPQMTSIHIPDCVKTIRSGSFRGCKNLEKVVLPKDLSRIEDQLFSGCNKLNDVVIPNSVTYIGKDAFSYCTELSNIQIPYGVQEIGDFAFMVCPGLQDIPIPSSVTTMGRAVFQACYGLTDIVIPEGIETIPMQTFLYCRNLKSVTIPESVKNIGIQAFQEINPWATISFLGSAPTLEKQAIPNSNTITAYYPAEEELSYETAKEQFPNVNWVALYPIMSGDINGDNTVNFQDAQLVLQYEAGLVTLSEEQLEAADVNGDGTINFQDAQLILQYEAGIIDSFEGSG